MKDILARSTYSRMHALCTVAVMMSIEDVEDLEEYVADNSSGFNDGEKAVIKIFTRFRKELESLNPDGGQ